MGGTGNSDTYPYGIQYAVQAKKDQVYNRVTGEVVEEFEPFGIEATKKINQLVAEFKNATATEKALIIAPKVAAHKAQAA